MAETLKAPRWDLGGIFPGLDSREFAAAYEALDADLDRLTALYDRHRVRGAGDSSAVSTDMTAFDEVVNATNAVLEQVRTLNAYVHGLLTTDARDDHAATVSSQLQSKLAGLQKLTTRFQAGSPGSVPTP